MTQQELQRIKSRFQIVGNSPALDRAIMMAAQVAPTPLSILITGENGTGKESFAKIVHHMSTMKHGDFVAVNCGAIPEGTMESELFGHEKGAFTGAGEKRKGYFEEADKGTIFLDEIGEMPLKTQPRLLRVLENKEFLPVGSSKKRTSNARVIAATNVNLQHRMHKGLFREDLYYRIAQITIQVPPLRERGEDILLLFRRFTLDFAENYKTGLVQLTDGAKSMLRSYAFPGNVRQLKNIAWQVAALEQDHPLVDEKRLAAYLPKVEASVPMLWRGEDGQLPKEERAMLYKTLLKVQQEGHALKKLLHQLLNSYEKGRDLIAQYPVLFKSLLIDSPKLLASKSEDSTDKVPKALPSQARQEQKPKEEFFSIAEQEKLLIRRALAKWKNRKEVATQLGIAERTLYRKIKEYGL